MNTSPNILNLLRWQGFNNQGECRAHRPQVSRAQYYLERTMLGLISLESQQGVKSSMWLFPGPAQSLQTEEHKRLHQTLNDWVWILSTSVNKTKCHLKPPPHLEVVTARVLPRVPCRKGGSKGSRSPTICISSSACCLRSFTARQLCFKTDTLRGPEHI